MGDFLGNEGNARNDLTIKSLENWNMVKNSTLTLLFHHSYNSAFLSAQTLAPNWVESCYFLACDLGQVT